jgi:hypothetical protein
MTLIQRKLAWFYGEAVLVLSLNLVAGHLAAAATTGDRITQVLSKQIEYFDVMSGDEFRDFCREFWIPCGEERSQTGSFGHLPGSLGGYHHRFTARNRTGKEILDEMVARHPGYHWHAEDGVLTFSLIRHDKFGPLERRLSYFEIHGGTVDDVIFNAVLQAKMSSSGGGSELSRPGQFEIDKSRQLKKIDVVLKNPSLREIFNAAVLKHGYATWVFQYADPERPGETNHVDWWVY